MLLICPVVFMAQQPLVVQGLLIVVVSQSYSGTPQSVGLRLSIRTSDQPDPEILYLTAHNTHKRQTSMPPAGLEPAIPESEKPKTHALDRAATGIDFSYVHNSFKYWLKMADTLSKEAWLCHSTGINKHVHNPNEKSRLTKYTTSLKTVNNINVTIQDARRSQ